jgi:hypothetical protein
MASDRSRYGLLGAAFGAVLLAVSVFLPWYGVSLTASGVAYAQQLGDQVAAQFGNAALQSQLGTWHTAVGSLAGHQVATVSAHQAFSHLSIVLLVLAGLALLDALFPLARAGGLGDGAGRALAVLGGIATLCVLFRMVVRPASFDGLLSLSLREGAWLSLLGALMMLGGGLWRPSMRSPRAPSEDRVEDALARLSGWTPQS